MLRRLAFALTLFATPAAADEPKPAPATPGQRADEILLNRERTEHQIDLGAAVQFQDQVSALTKQVDELTKERDALKASAKADPAPAGGPK